VYSGHAEARMLFFLFAALTQASIRQSDEPEPPATFEERHGHERFKNPDITGKFDAWENFFQIMFTISCRSKHSTDVKGLAQEVWKNADGKLDMETYTGLMKEIQAENVAGMKESCGMITAEGSPKCRMACQTNHGDNMAMRDACDSKCETKYRNFEDECYNKVETLKNVYSVELGMLANYYACADMHCKDYPVTDNCSEEQLADLEKCKNDMVTDMQKEATTDFCEAMWDWIYESNAIDPATGDPIVFTQLDQPQIKKVQNLRH
jgi:hypothetical protein